MADATGWGLRLALERRNYRLFVAGQLVSLIGTWTQSVAQSWLVYRLTGSAFWLGVASFCQQAPAFLFASVGGLIADRHRRRTILVVTQSSAMVLAFALATRTLSGHVGVASVLVRRNTASLPRSTTRERSTAALQNEAPNGSSSRVTPPEVAWRWSSSRRRTLKRLPVAGWLRREPP